MKPSELPYRPCVGIVLVNAAGLIWIGRRCNSIAEDGGNWQMPQGGIDENEEPAFAARRELLEETGTDKAEIIGETSGWHDYDLPPELVGVVLHGRYRGQTQKWFAMRFLGQDSDFNIHHPPLGNEPEFDDWRWAHSDEVLRRIIAFKRPVYQAVLDEFRPLILRP